MADVSELIPTTWSQLWPFLAGLVGLSIGKFIAYSFTKFTSRTELDAKKELDSPNQQAKLIETLLAERGQLQEAREEERLRYNHDRNEWRRERTEYDSRLDDIDAREAECQQRLRAHGHEIRRMQQVIWALQLKAGIPDDQLIDFEYNSMLSSNENIPKNKPKQKHPETKDPKDDDSS